MDYVDQVKDRNGNIADIHDTGAREDIAALQEAVAGKADVSDIPLITLSYQDDFDYRGVPVLTENGFAKLKNAKLPFLLNFKGIGDIDTALITRYATPTMSTKDFCGVSVRGSGSPIKYKVEKVIIKEEDRRLNYLSLAYLHRYVLSQSGAYPSNSSALYIVSSSPIALTFAELLAEVKNQESLIFSRYDSGQGAAVLGIFAQPASEEISVVKLSISDSTISTIKYSQYYGQPTIEDITAL